MGVDFPVSSNGSTITKILARVGRIVYTHSGSLTGYEVIYLAPPVAFRLNIINLLSVLAVSATTRTVSASI